MKNLLMILVLCLAMLATGCTMTETATERDQRIAHLNDVNRRMLVEDWDEFWFYGRASHLTNWNLRTGIWE